MLALLARSRRAPRSIRPHLEQLEDRLSPAVMEMLSLNVAYLPNKEVTLSGSLFSQSGAVANQTINLGGVVSGTATTNAQGAYSVTLPVSKLGQVTAASADGLSGTMNATLVGGTPTINGFSAVPQGGGVWLFSGYVTGAPTQGEVIHFDGLTALADKSCNVNPDGSFSYYCRVFAGQGGIATAEATDWWGDTSSTVTKVVVA